MTIQSLISIITVVWMLILIYVVRKIKCQILISAFEGNFNLISKVVIVFKQNIFSNHSTRFSVYKQYCWNTIMQFLSKHGNSAKCTFLQMDVGKMALFFGTIAWIFFILMHTQIVHIKNSNILSNIQPDKIYVWSSIGANMKYSLQQ